MLILRTWQTSSPLMHMKATTDWPNKRRFVRQVIIHSIHLFLSSMLRLLLTLLIISVGQPHQVTTKLLQQLVDSLLDLLHNTLLLMCSLGGPTSSSVVATSSSSGGTGLCVGTSPVTSTVARLASGSGGTITVGNTLRGRGSVISTGGRVATTELVFSPFSFVGGASMFLTGTLYTANRVCPVITLSTSKGASATRTTKVILEDTLVIVVSTLPDTVGVRGEVLGRSSELVGVSGV